MVKLIQDYELGCMSCKTDLASEMYVLNKTQEQNKFKKNLFNYTF